MSHKMFEPKRLINLEVGRAITIDSKVAREIYTRVPGGWIRDRIVTVEYSPGTLCEQATSVFIPC